MSEINWGIIDPNASKRGAEMSQGIFDRVRQEQTRRATGNALNALMRDPNATPESLNALAMLAPDTAAQLIKFQQGQQDRSREQDFRSALSDYYGGGGMNALMPRAPMTPGAMKGDSPPPISAAPPPPADWQARVGPVAMAGLSAPDPNGVPASNGPLVPATGGASALPTPSAVGQDAPSFRPAETGGSLVPVDPNAVDPYAAQGIGAELGAAGQPAPETQADTPLPPEIERAANSPDMGVRNAAFRRMMQIDPVQAMKIQSDERDRTLDAMEDSVKAFRWASEALSNARDDASYKQILARVQQATAPLGLDIASMVPGTHPGPEGIRQLQYQALDISQRLAAIDRRFTAEANVADDLADNARADRNTDNIIANRDARTSLSSDRERRIASGARRGGGGKKSGGNTVLKNGTVIQPKGGGPRLVYYNGKLRPLTVSQ